MMPGKPFQFLTLVLCAWFSGRTATWLLPEFTRGVGGQSSRPAISKNSLRRRHAPRPVDAPLRLRLADGDSGTVQAIPSPPASLAIHSNDNDGAHRGEDRKSTRLNSSH